MCLSKFPVLFVSMFCLAQSGQLCFSMCYEAKWSHTKTSDIMCEKSTSSILVFSEYFATRVGSSNITQPHFPSDEITGGLGGGGIFLYLIAIYFEWKLPFSNTSRWILSRIRAVRSTPCCGRESMFGSQNQPASSQLSVIPVPGYLMSFLGPLVLKHTT